MSQQHAHDPVNHPSHYTHGKVECIVAIEAALGPEGFVAYLRGQVIKYNWRLGRKDAAAQDAGKAKWYQDLLAQRLQQQAEAAKIASNALQSINKQTPPKVSGNPIQGAALTERKGNENGQFACNGPSVKAGQFGDKFYGTIPELQQQFPGESISWDGLYGHYVYLPES